MKRPICATTIYVFIDLYTSILPLRIIFVSTFIGTYPSNHEGTSSNYSCSSDSCRGSSQSLSLTAYASLKNSKDV